MREIKFRVWDKDFKCWINNIGMKANNVLCNGTEKRFYVMQYTGLKDKNGKEIYEGDILNCLFVNYNFGVEWDNNFACYNWYVLTETEELSASLANSIEESTEKAGKTFMEIVEVIGNIYENPELLEQNIF